MCDTVNKFIDLMKPYVLNIIDDYHKLKEKEKVVNNLDNIYKTIDGDSLKIFDISFDKIEEEVDNFKSNKKEFDANKYILQTEIDEVKALPQYVDAKKYIDNFYNYLNEELSKLESEFHELSETYEKKELVNKYYEMFINNNVFVSCVEELKQVFEILNLEIELKNNVLIYILKENNKCYNNGNVQLFTDNEKEKALGIIKNNKELDSKDYNELLDAVDEYVDLTKKIDEIINYDLIKKINICNIVLAKKIWLYRKLKFSYYNMNCQKCNCIIKQFDNICDLYEKIRKNKTQEEIISIIKGES